MTVMQLRCVERPLVRRTSGLHDLSSCAIAAAAHTGLLDMEPLVPLLTQGTASMLASNHAHQCQYSTALPDPVLRVLGMLRQAAWLLVHVGVRAAHLYLYSCNQQPGPHTGTLQHPLTSTKQAYQLVEMGKLADHSKVAVLLQLLRCWAAKVRAVNTGHRILPPAPQPVLVLLLAHPLVLHALQRDVQACGFSVQLVGNSAPQTIAAALQAVAPPSTPCCVCLPSSIWPPHCTPSALRGARGCT